MTWYNINLRTLLGDMYDDYDCLIYVWILLLQDLQPIQY
jgi:hypothetical protein